MNIARLNSLLYAISLSEMCQVWADIVIPNTAKAKAFQKALEQ
jgi:hypothetical protein